MCIGLVDGQARGRGARLRARVAVGGRHDVGQGRLLPDVSVDQYGATLAKWMGVAAGDLGMVFPNIGKYALADLGFMKA